MTRWGWQRPPQVSCFAQIGAGSDGVVGFETNLIFVNTGEDSRLQLEFFDSAHQPLPLNLGEWGRGADFELSLPRGGSRSLSESRLTTYSHIEGVAHRTRFVSGAEGFGVRMGGAELRLGSGPIAAALRNLGLPRRALMSTWMEHMRARFDAPEKL